VFQVADALTAAILFSKGADRVGAGRIALLEAIGEHGSITAAAREVGLSYKAAWDAVQALNNLADRPLVEAHPGGKRGGAARVTARGEAVIAAFRQLEQELSRSVSSFESRLKDAPNGPPLDLFWSLGMRTSARNALRGVVWKVTEGAVNVEVTLKVSDGFEVVAIITRDSLASLGLKPGSPAIALIKSSFVVLAAGETPPRTSARNALSGRVVRREDGAVNSEITLDLGQGKTITAVITTESAKALDLKVGEPATALIKASHVILAVE
jgi:molybdate transport system regulatory protein